MRRCAAQELHVELVDFSAFLKLREPWDALVSQSPLDAPFLRHDFIRIWLENFAPAGRLTVWTVLRNGRLALALPLLESRGLFRGLPARIWRAPVNVHSCRFDLVVGRAREGDGPDLDAVEVLTQSLLSRSDFDVIELPDVPDDGVARRLLDGARRRGFPTHTWESMRTPWVDLPDTEDALTARLSGHFRQNVRRRRRKLEALGPLSLHRFEGGSDLEALLEEGFQLERSGWKGAAKTAIACSPKLRAFYSEWARSNALSGELVLHFLRLGDRAIAFQFGIASGRAFYLPKVGFDEWLSDCSPGQVLMDEVLRDLIRRGVRRFDFLGPSMPWKRDWATGERRHDWLYVFGKGLRGRLLHRLKSRSWRGPREATGCRRAHLIP